MTPLSTLLSQALVAHTIELDNEAEYRLPHRTTRQSGSAVPRDTPWLVSFSLWANVLQYLDEEGSTVAQLRARARTSQLLLSGLRRWGYVTVTAPPGQPLRSPPQDDAIVRPRKAALRAGRVWTDLPGVVDDRWRARLGATPVNRLERALRAAYDRIPIDPPAYLPVIHPTQGAKSETPPVRAQGSRQPEAASCATTLSPLLSGVLVGFTVDVESTARVSLPISANTLRVLDGLGTPVAVLPRLTGVSREANAMCTGWLERRGCAVTEADPTGRGKRIRLTAKGTKAQHAATQHVHDTEEDWRVAFGAVAVDELRSALEAVVGDGTPASSPLAAGLVPYPDNWRAGVRRPDTLPHHPVVLHRGGFPDGS